MVKTMSLGLRFIRGVRMLDAFMMGNLLGMGLILVREKKVLS